MAFFDFNSKAIEGRIMSEKHTPDPNFDDEEMAELTALLGGIIQCVNDRDRCALEYAVGYMVEFLGWEMVLPEMILKKYRRNQ